MRTLKTTAFSIILVLVLVVGTRIFLCYAQEPYQATVEDLSGAKYFPAVKEALSKAEKSIYMAMYFVNFNPGDKRSAVNELVEELICAHKRGVKVKVILDQNINFGALEEGSGRWEREAKNDSLFLYLRKNGIEVYYDNLFMITHSKVIIIDEEIVILGSANWTMSSLKRNWEASCLIRSKALAKQFLEDFSKITIDYEASILDEERKPPVILNQSFLKNPSLGSRMLTDHDDAAFELYLFLLRNFDGNAQGKVDIDYQAISHALGLDKESDYIAARDVLLRALTRLEEKYQLIRREKRPPKSPYAILLDYPNKTPYILPQEGYCSIPDEYWKYGWNTRLSLAQKYCYLISCYKGGAAKGHIWSAHIIGLSKDFNVSRDTIQRGIQGLRKLNIIEIEYSPYPEGGKFEHRESSLFRLLGLYSPEVLENEKERLRGLYGKKRFEEAQKYAEIVFKGSDIQVIEDIIKKIDEYGDKEVNSTFKIVSGRSAANPKRSYKYVVGILQTKAREAGAIIENE